MPLLSRPRSTYCFMNCDPTPDGTKTRRASGLESAAFCRKGAKSGLASGTRRFSTCPPALVKVSVKAFSTSMPGP